MKIVLFGAGASFGAGRFRPKAPPLGFQLFDSLSKLFSTWRSVPQDAKSLFESNFEEGMAHVINNHGFAVAPLMQEMAIFFAQFRPDSQQSLYDDLFADPAVFKDVIFATLNYECLLEYAISRSGHGINYFGEIDSSSSQIPVWKLHGSCHFKVKNIEATRGVSFGMGVTFGGDIELIEPPDVEPLYGGNTALYPAMALYSEGKPISMAPGPVKEAQKRWRERCCSATDIVIIGVNPNHKDDHVWAPIADSGGKVHFVGSASAFDDWKDEYRPGKENRFCGSTWSSADREVKDILAT